ncbi:glycosyltransferase [Thermoproteota archaeon]
MNTQNPDIKISVVIGTYNQKEVIKLVLDAFNKQSMPKDEFEVVVVDSTSTDGTTEMLKKYEPSYNFQHLVKANQGKAYARNIGVENAKANLIIITDGDMIPDKDFVKAHFNAHQNIAQPACFEGLTYNLKKLEWPTTPDNTAPYITRNYKSGAPLGWFYFLTGNISFQKSLFLKNNGFDTDFKGYGWEDIELGYRLSKQHVPLYYLKEAANYHYHVVDESEDIKRCVDKGRSAKIVWQKHPNLKTFLGLNPLSVWVFKHTKKDGPLHNFMKTKCYNSKSPFLHGLGLWFLKEYNYLEGILEK